MKNRVLFVLFFHMIAFSSLSYAEVPDCKVGDLTKGWWVIIKHYTKHECPFPGEHAEDSQWPKIGEFLTDQPHRIIGKLKFVGWVAATGRKEEPIPPREECITGLAKAYAAAYLSNCVKSGACTISGSLITYSSGTPPNIRYSYTRVWDTGYYLSEWHCYATQPVDKKTNQGSPSCPVDL